MEELRLFPLNTVLYPGMPLPLRIFEERYKLMIGECLDKEEPFGVILIKEGPEVGGPAAVYNVGVAARIDEVEHHEEGRMSISTTGDRRFRLLEVIEDIPYMKGSVEYLGEDLSEGKEEAYPQAAELFGNYIQLISSLQGGWLVNAPVPADSMSLSYTIAHYLDLPRIAKQRLLEIPTAGERLKYEIPLLEGAMERIREALLKRNPYQGPRLN